MRIAGWGGNIGTIRTNANDTTTYFFAGPRATVTTTATQRLTGAAEAPLALGMGLASTIKYGLCYQPTAGGDIVNFMGEDYSTAQITATRIPWSAAATVVPGAGQWEVGFCLANNTPSMLTISNTNWVNGWVMVTNQ